MPGSLARMSLRQSPEAVDKSGSSGDRWVWLVGGVWWVWLSLSLLFHRLDLVANYVKLRGRAGGIFQHRVSFE